MTSAGWIFLAVSWGAILGLGVFCLSRTFRKKA
jgi:hypothetical protein